MTISVIRAPRGIMLVNYLQISGGGEELQGRSSSSKEARGGEDKDEDEWLRWGATGPGLLVGLENDLCGLVCLVCCFLLTRPHLVSLSRAFPLFSLRFLSPVGAPFFVSLPRTPLSSVSHLRVLSLCRRRARHPGPARLARLHLMLGAG